MLINELPNDCLLTIFDYINDLEDLINCYKVCERWNNLIVARTKKVKYLIDQPDCLPDCVHHQLEEPIDVTCLSKLFPNLKIADFSYPFHKATPIEDIVTLVRDSKSLKGLIYENPHYDQLILECANLEMISTGYIDPSICEINETVKQLHLWSSTLDLFKLVVQNFPNLERLKIFNGEDRTDHYSDGPILVNLKIVEMALSSYDGEDFCCSFIFMDSCPVLQSAHIKIDSSRISINDAIKHLNLQDLVIHFYEPIEWNELRRLMSKYPNLKHLALRNNFLQDEHIKQLLLILPRLELLDVRESHGVTQEAANYVRDHCKAYGRSTKFYFKEGDNQIESDWPQLSTRHETIGRGFDFMKNCFLKPFYCLPHFLDPMID